MNSDQRAELRQAALRARETGAFRVANERTAETPEQKLERLARMNRERVQRYRRRHGRAAL